MRSELARRIVFTLGALLIYRLGSYIPVPGVHYSGTRIAIFSMGILPYLSAAILIQLISVVWSKLASLPRSGEAGRRKIVRYTLVLAIAFTLFQSLGVARALQQIPGAVDDPGAMFLLSTVLTMTGGTVFLIWLSELITKHGIGNGLAVLIFVNVTADLPRAVAQMLEWGRQGEITQGQALVTVAVWAALLALVVFVELARRRVPLEFAARSVGGRTLAAQPGHLSLKVNSAGMLPTVVAPWFYLMPLTLAGLLFDPTTPWLLSVYRFLQQNHTGRVILTAALILIVTFIYTAFVADPEYAADSLQRHGAVIPGVEPGEPTADHLDRVVSYTTCVGAIYLVLLFLIPELLLVFGGAPFHLTGVSVLVVVCTVLDIERQVRGQSHIEPGGQYS
jgi:preprotein translocase subunit SecY